MDFSDFPMDFPMDLVGIGCKHQAGWDGFSNDTAITEAIGSES